MYLLPLNCCRAGLSGRETVMLYLREWRGRSSREKVRRFTRHSFSHPSSEEFEKLTMERPFYIVDPMARSIDWR